MGMLVGDDRFMGCGERRQGESVGRRAGAGEAHLGVHVQELADEIAGAGAHFVLTVGAHEPAVVTAQGFENLGHGAGDVV